MTSDVWRALWEGFGGLELTGAGGGGVRGFLGLVVAVFLDGRVLGPSFWEVAVGLELGVGDFAALGCT